MMDMQTVYPRVAKIISEVLVIDESKIAMTKRLIADLGAESIDLLDLIFQLEREFKIKVPLRQIEKEARGTLSDAEFEQNGVVTAEGMKTLSQHLTEVPAEFFKANLKVNEIPTLFTVGTFCKIVVNAVAKQNQPVTA
jgi:acyl carrier protein